MARVMHDDKVEVFAFRATGLWHALVETYDYVNKTYHPENIPPIGYSMDSGGGHHFYIHDGGKR